MKFNKNTIIIQITLKKFNKFLCDSNKMIEGERFQQ